MRLLTELLGAQDVELAHLPGQSLGVGEALGKEHDLGNQSIVRYHHRHGTEAHLYRVFSACGRANGFDELILHGGELVGSLMLP